VDDHRVAVAEDMHVVPAPYLYHEQNAVEEILLAARSGGDGLELFEKAGEIVRRRPEPGHRNGFPEQRSQDRLLLRPPRRKEQKELFPAVPAGYLLIYERVLAAAGPEAHKGGTLHLHHPEVRG
jgi:hypothetical protein